MYHLRLACLLLTVCLQQVLPEQEQRWIDHWSACNATTQPFSEQQQQPGGLPPNVHLSTSQSLEQTSDEPEISKPAHRFNIRNLKSAKLHGVCKERTALKVVKKVHGDEIKQPSNQSTQQKMEASSDPGAPSEDSSSIQNPAEVIRGVFDALAPEMKVGGNPLVPFMDLGLGSLEMEAVADGLTKALGTTVNPPMLFDYPCLQALTGQWHSAHFSIHGIEDEDTIGAASEDINRAASESSDLGELNIPFVSSETNLPSEPSTAVSYKVCSVDLLSELVDVDTLLDQLERLESSWPASMRQDRQVVQDRIFRDPKWQFVLVSEGLAVPHVVGSLYTQRIGSVEALLNAVYAELAELHDPGGDVLQLIGVQTLSRVSAGAGGLLLNHAFEAAAKHSLASVAAVTRCRTFSHNSRDLLSSMRAHTAGDPGVLFHTSRGALLVDLVSSYRPEDSANGGVGVLLRYNLAPSVVENLVSQMQGRPLCTEKLHSVEQSGLSFYYLNHHGEVDYTYEEVFRRSCYLQHGAKVGAGGIVFDVGANQGLFSVFCSGLAANVQVHSFEPIPAIYDVSAKNRELYQVQGHHHNVGLAEQAESVDFTFYPGLSVLSGRYANSDDDTRTFMQYDSFAHKNRSKDRQEVMQAIDSSQMLLTLCGL